MKKLYEFDAVFADDSNVNYEDMGIEAPTESDKFVVDLDEILGFNPSNKEGHTTLRFKTDFTSLTIKAPFEEVKQIFIKEYGKITVRTNDEALNESTGIRDQAI